MAAREQLSTVSFTEMEGTLSISVAGKMESGQKQNIIEMNKEQIKNKTLLEFQDWETRLVTTILSQISPLKSAKLLM